MAVSYNNIDFWGFGKTCHKKSTHFFCTQIDFHLNCTNNVVFCTWVKTNWNFSIFPSANTWQKCIVTINLKMMSAKKLFTFHMKNVYRTQNIVLYTLTATQNSAAKMVNEIFFILNCLFGILTKDYILFELSLVFLYIPFSL